MRSEEIAVNVFFREVYHFSHFRLLLAACLCPSSLIWPQLANWHFFFLFKVFSSVVACKRCVWGKLVRGDTKKWHKIQELDLILEYNSGLYNVLLLLFSSCPFFCYIFVLLKGRWSHSLCMTMKITLKNQKGPPIWVFSCSRFLPCYFLPKLSPWRQNLGFCKASGDNLNSNRCSII